MKKAKFLKLRKKPKIAFIGGLDRLEQHYKEVSKSLGCELYYHNGKGKEDRIRKIVRKCDLVFCPVNINSHNACMTAKKICKKYNKPCVFLKSSSVSSFKRVLIHSILVRPTLP